MFERSLAQNKVCGLDCVFVYPVEGMCEKEFAWADFGGNTIRYDHEVLREMMAIHEVLRV